MSFTIVLLIAFAALLGSPVESAKNEECPESSVVVPTPDLAIDLISKQGLYMQFPYYSSTLRELEPELKKLLVEDMVGTLSYIKEVMNAKLTGTAGWKYNWASVIANMISMGRAQSKKRREANLKQVVGIKAQFSVDMSNMFAIMLKKSQSVEKELKKVDKIKLNEQLGELIDSLSEGFSKSPVASYVDMRSAKINGVDFIDYAANIMGQLRRSGYGAILTAVDKLIALKIMLCGN